jgi:hypothetical protein
MIFAHRTTVPANSEGSDGDIVLAVDGFYRKSGGVWSALAAAFTPAADSGAIPDPSSATAEDVATKYNTLRTNLRTAGLMA